MINGRAKRRNKRDSSFLQRDFVQNNFNYFRFKYIWQKKDLVTCPAPFEKMRRALKE